LQVGEEVTVRTDLTIRKWDANQAGWARRHADRDFAGSRGNWPSLFEYYRIRPYETWHQKNVNNIVQAGWVALLGGIAGTTITNKFSATNGRIGAGTSSTAVSYSQTALVGDTGGSSTTSYYQLVSGAPVIVTATSPPTLTLTAVFGTGVANYAWNEFGSDNYTASGVTATGLGAGVIFFNRGVPAGGMGVKVAGQVWTASETLNFGFPSGSGTVS
jgi:hypothetical protein